jgi:hypothetical protein
MLCDRMDWALTRAALTTPAGTMPVKLNSVLDDTPGAAARSDALSCPTLAQRAALWGSFSRTNRGQTIKRPDRRPGDQASDLQLLGSGGRI